MDSNNDGDTTTTTTQMEIKVMHAKHLWAFNFFQKLCVYAAVSLSSDLDSHLLSKDQMQEQRTSFDADGDGNPEWNHPMKFHLSDPTLPSSSDLFLRFELRHHAGLIFPDRTIGEVKVPLTDLLESAENFRFVDYQVRSPDGKPNGVLRFAYKLNRNPDKAHPSDSDHLEANISGYPRIFDQHQPPEKPHSNLYPAAYLSETTLPSPVASDDAYPAVDQTHLPSNSSVPPQPQYPAQPPPMWPPPPPPQHPPYWAPSGLMGNHPPPPPPPFPRPPFPPPGYGHPSWGYHLQPEGQHHSGSYEQRRV